MTPEDAFYAVVHDYPGGAEALAPRMGYSAAVLRNKADPKKDSNKPLLRDADAVSGLTGDYRILQALAHKHGFLLVKAPHGAMESCDMAVLEEVVGLSVANGQYMVTIQTALADGKVDRMELAKINEAKRMLQTKAESLSLRIEGMAE